MTKIENHKQDLFALFEVYCKSSDAQKIKDYIVSNSNLPSPRANLELAKAFADLIQDYSKNESEKVWGLCSELIKIFAEEAPTNDPQEFLPFCGAYGIGAIGSVSPQYFEQALSTLKMLANDFRWRMREAVCFGLQRMMRKRSHDVLKRLETWIGDGSLLQLRAVIAAVADPPLLKNKQLATIALRLHKRIINSLHHLKERKFEDFRTLKKALGFTLSVVVCEIPETGFKFMHELVNSTDPDIRWIVTDNLKKNRLIKDFPEQVELLKKQL